MLPSKLIPFSRLSAPGKLTGVNNMISLHKSIPRWLRYLSIVLHVASALATIGGFIIHVYMGTAMVRGGFTSIIRGEVSTAWAKTHHRLWYEQVTGDRSAKKD